MTLQIFNGKSVFNLCKQLNKAQTDGTFSATVGTIADNAVTTAKIVNGALSADATGRAKMADNFVNSAKILADAVTTVKILNANVTPEKLTAIANTRVFSYQVADLGAGADITTRAIFEAPAGATLTITGAKIISQGTAAGIDDSNTCVVSILNGTNSIASITFDTDPAFPAENVSASLGALNGTYKVLAAGEKLHLVVTNGTTANPPAFMLQVEYTIATA